MTLTTKKIEEQLTQAATINDLKQRYRTLRSCLVYTILRDEDLPLQRKCGEAFFSLAIEAFNTKNNALLQSIFSTLKNSGIVPQVTVIFEQHMALGFGLRSMTSSLSTTNEAIWDDRMQLITTAQIALNNRDYVTALSATTAADSPEALASTSSSASEPENQRVDYLRIKMCAEVGLFKLKQAKETHRQLFEALSNEGVIISDETKYTYIAVYKILQANPFVNKAYPLILPNTNPNQPNIVAKYFPHIPLVFSCVYHYSTGEHELFSTYVNNTLRCGVEVELAFNLILEALAQKTQQHTHTLNDKGITALRIQQATKLLPPFLQLHNKYAPRYTQNPQADTRNFRKLITSVMQLIQCTAPYDKDLGGSLANQLLGAAVGFLSLAAMRETDTEFFSVLSRIQSARRYLQRGEYKQAYQSLVDNKKSTYAGKCLPLIQATSSAIQAVALHDYKLDKITTAQGHRDRENQQNEQLKLRCYAAVFSAKKTSGGKLSTSDHSKLLEMTAFSRGPTGT